MPLHTCISVEAGRNVCQGYRYKYTWHARAEPLRWLPVLRVLLDVNTIRTLNPVSQLGGSGGTGLNEIWFNDCQSASIVWKCVSLFGLQLPEFAHKYEESELPVAPNSNFSKYWL